METYAGDLVIIDDAPQNADVAALRDYLGLTGVWLGMTDLALEGLWMWVDGSVAAYLNWAANEPNNAGGEHCAALRPESDWDDRDCDLNRDYVCER